MTHTQVDNATKSNIHDHEGVVAVGEGERDGYPALIVSVTPESGLGPADFRENVQGLPVYVEERSEIQRFASNTEILDPIRGGQTITNTTGSGRGTSSFIMTDGDKAYASSNYHVLTPNGSDDVGDRVGHLALTSNRGIKANQLIGTVAGHIPYNTNSPADFAWVELDDGLDTTNRVAGVGLVTDTGHVSPGDNVTKGGSRTGVTHGTVDQIGATVGVAGTDGNVVMQDQAMTAEAMSNSGDSGSPVVEQNTTTAVGVLWGGGNDTTVFSPISNVENNCPLQVATHDVDGDGGSNPEPNEPPNASFQNVNKQPLWAKLESTSSDPDGHIVSHEWDWEDGHTSTGEIVEHTYDSPGQYSVQLTVTDDRGAEDLYSRTVVIHPPEDDPNQGPTADFQNVNKQPLWVKLESVSSDPDGQIVSHTWDWNDGTTSTGQVAEHTYDSPGSYSVTLTVEDNNGATDTYSRSVVINAPDDGNGGGETDQSGMGAVLALGLAGAYLRSRMD